MANKKDSGVYQLPSGYWGYRFSIIIDGKTLSKKKTTDESKNKLKTKQDAIKARNLAISKVRNSRNSQPKVLRRTFCEVYLEYRAKGCTGKAYATLRKQDSLWNNHLKDRFGSRFVDDVTVAEIKDYLSELYYAQEYSFMYTESFLKLFYLIFGQAYSRNYMDVDTYNKLCVNKDTKISMPKMKTNDSKNIIAFNHEQISLLDSYFKGTNAETAYLLGKYCGLRISECFGLKWDHVNLIDGTIFIDRQMQYQDKIIRLVPVKTRNAVRTIYLCDKLIEYLELKLHQIQSIDGMLSEVRTQKRRLLTDIDGKSIYSTDMVNCLLDGTNQTVNSFKYPSREIKQNLGIDFKYHYLRHTYGTMMAEKNTPQHLLCKQMGHGNIHVTQLYYLAITDNGIDTLRKNINSL